MAALEDRRRAPSERTTSAPWKFDEEVLACAGLVAGTAVGGGVLAIPAVAAPCGLVPASSGLVLCWAFLAAQGWVLLDVIAAVPRRRPLFAERGTGRSMGGLAAAAFGERWGVGAAALYALFLNATLVAQLSKAGMVVATLAGGRPGLYAGATVALGGGALLLCQGGGVRAVGLASSALVLVLLVTFGALCSSALVHADWGVVTSSPARWSELPHALPVFLQVLSFNSILPSVGTVLRGNLPRMRGALLIGSAVPLVVALTWNAVAVGLAPQASAGAGASLAATDPINLLLAEGGPVFSVLTGIFALSAAATTVIGMNVSLVDLITEALSNLRKGATGAQADAAQVQSPAPAEEHTDEPSKLLAALLAGVPAIGLASLSPSIFYDVMGYSGAYIVPSLFCVLPPAMAWALGRGSRASPWCQAHLLVLGGGGFACILAQLFVDLV